MSSLQNLLQQRTEIEKEAIKTFYYNFADLFEDIKKYMKDKNFSTSFIIVEKIQNSFNDGHFEDDKILTTLVCYSYQPNNLGSDKSLFIPLELELTQIFPNKEYLKNPIFNQYLLDYQTNNHNNYDISPRMKLSKMINSMLNVNIDFNKTLQKIHEEELSMQKITNKKETLEKKLNKNIDQTNTSKKLKI